MNVAYALVKFTRAKSYRKNRLHTLVHEGHLCCGRMDGVAGSIQGYHFWQQE